MKQSRRSFFGKILGGVAAALTISPRLHVTNVTEMGETVPVAMNGFLLTGIPVSSPGVSARKIYRSNGQGVFTLLATIHDGRASYVDRGVR